jgi:Immunity protein 35
MITEDEARRIGERDLDQSVRPDAGPDIVITGVLDYPGFWVVTYNTRAFVETGSFLEALAGNSPIIIDKVTGKSRFGNTAQPIEEQLDAQ